MIDARAAQLVHRLERHFDDVERRERVTRSPSSPEERLGLRFSDPDFSPVLLDLRAQQLFSTWRAWLVDAAREHTSRHLEPALLGVLERIAVMLAFRGDHHLELAESYGVWSVESLGLLNS